MPAEPMGHGLTMIEICAAQVFVFQLRRSLRDDQLLGWWITFAQESAHPHTPARATIVSAEHEVLARSA